MRAMSDYRRLISYIYAYEGGEKGKNIGFAKIDMRGPQCRIQVNVKKVYVGSSDRLGFGYRPCGDSCGRWRTFSKRCDRRNVYRYHFGSSLPILFVLISGNSKRE